jgi:hypothetical protein
VHRILTLVAFGWLTIGGTLHFAIDVVSQYLRRVRPPGPETTLYFGLNTAYALGQILFGILAFLVTRQGMDVLGRWPGVTLCLAATLCWLAFGFLFLQYWEPRVMIAVFGVLVIAAAVTG